MPLDEDHHVHSTFSDGASTVEENIAAARDRGLTRLCLTDHVRASTRWLPDYVACLRSLRERSQPAPQLAVTAGVEVKMLDAQGSLDLPPGLPGVELVLIADHQFPGERGPVDPAEMRTAIAAGRIGSAEAAAAVADATAAALATNAGLDGRDTVLAHLFSILPKMGLDESALPDAGLDRLIARAAQTGAAVEVNEKWSCPSPAVVSAFAAAGVPVVAGSDSHDQASVGVFRSVRRTLDAVAAGGR
ncbi:MAG TPA: PHP domain-containing protein [Streptosporangiaceae bacterium]